MRLSTGESAIFWVAVAVLSLLMCCAAVQADSDTRIRRQPAFRQETNQLAPEFAPSFSKVAPMRLRLPDQPSGKTLKGNVNDDAVRGGLTQVELNKLAAHDIVLVIDKSFSMMTRDCPAGTFDIAKLGVRSAFGYGKSDLDDLSSSRWNWCFNQTLKMAKQTQGVLSNGFTVILFDNNYHVFEHVTVDQLPNIFGSNHPWGHTNMASPLEASFNDYLRRKRMTNGRLRPLLVGVISDGCPTQPEAAREAIIEATHKVKDPREISVVFFLIGGDDRKGERFVSRLCNNLVQDGARYPAVKAVPFNVLARIGLARALADNLN